MVGGDALGEVKIRKGGVGAGCDMLCGIPLMSLRHAVVVAEVLNFRHAANVFGVTQSRFPAEFDRM
jgi:hypothetical protein